MKIGFVSEKRKRKERKETNFLRTTLWRNRSWPVDFEHWLKLKRPVKWWVPYSCQACRAEYRGLQIRHFWVPSWTPLSRARVNFYLQPSWWEEEVWEKRVTDSSSIIASSSFIELDDDGMQGNTTQLAFIIRTQPRRYSNRSSWLPDLQQFHSSSLDQSSASPKRSQPLSTKKAVVVSKIAIPFQH